MIKTYEIDLDDSLVNSASELFEALGSNIDAAIAIFLKQAILRKGFPFDVTIPEENESGKSKTENDETEVPEESSEYEADCEDIHEGVSDEEECAVASVNSFSEAESPEIAARVAANEALVEQMRNEIGDKAVTPEFDENEDDGTHGDYDSDVKTENETPSESDSSSDDEDEDETTPDNLFDAWDVGDEEEIGCR